MRGLPLRDSSLGTALEIRQVGEWGNLEELLAILVEVSDAGNRLFFAAHAKKGTRPPKPIKLRRPGDPTPEQERAERRPATSEELAAFFGGSVRYTGPPAGELEPASARCERGHFVKRGAPCARCAPAGPAPADE